MAYPVNSPPTSTKFRALEYEAQPNYAYLRKNFSHLFARRRYSHDNIFDWALKHFSIIHPLTVAVDRQPESDHSPPPLQPPSQKKNQRQTRPKRQKGSKGGEAAKAGKCLRCSVKEKERKIPCPKMQSLGEVLAYGQHCTWWVCNIYTGPPFLQDTWV